MHNIIKIIKLFLNITLSYMYVMYDGWNRNVFLLEKLRLRFPLEVWKRHGDTRKSLEIDALFAYVYSYVGAEQTTSFLAAIRVIHLFIYSPVLRISYNINRNMNGIRVHGARLKLL